MPQNPKRARVKNRDREKGRKSDAAERGPIAPAKPASTAPRFAGIWPAEKTHRRILLGLLAVAFALRAFRLKDLYPVLIDEAIYIRWVEIIDHQGQWLISLLDGKPPLTYWLLAVARIAWDGDPLVQGRLLSVLAGVATTIVLYAVAKRLAPAGRGEAAGLIAAGLYACFPYALLYDRLAYTDAVVNLFGALIALTSLVAFSESGASWKRELAPGLAFGLGLFTKQTVLLFGAVPIACAFALARSHKRNWLLRALLVYAIAALFLLGNHLLTPPAPTLESHNAVLHHTGYFADPAELLANPLQYATTNIPKLASYFGIYLTWPLTLAAFASLAFAAWKRTALAWVVLSAAIVPLTVEVFVLSLMFPSRYAFPHFWPWLVAAAVGLSATWAEIPKLDWSSARRRVVLAVAALALAVPLVYQVAGMLAAPRDFLYEKDSTDFLGDYAHSGWRIPEAIEYLKREARTGPFVLLTDPIWGPPADVLFAYLNKKHGIQVYEAWWTQLSGDHHILPKGEAELLKSHYERVSLGKLDFAQVDRVFYVTDTNYYKPPEVHVRQPDAELVAEFVKPFGRQAIHVYRLK